MNTVLDIYVEDRNQRPIPGAKVTFYVNGQDKGGAETSGEPNRPVKLQATEDYQVVEVRVEYLTHRIDPVKVNPQQTRQFTFHLDEVELPAPKPGPPPLPPWFPIAGVVFAAVTILFFMGLVAAQLFGFPLPNNAGMKFTLTALLALCAGFTFTFLGAEAIASGVLPIPFLRDKPIAFSAAGGVAVLIIVYILANTFYPSPENITWRVSPEGQIDLGNVRVGAQKGVDVTVYTNSQTPFDIVTEVALGHGDDARQFSLAEPSSGKVSQSSPLALKLQFAARRPGLATADVRLHTTDNQQSKHVSVKAEVARFVVYALDSAFSRLIYNRQSQKQLRSNAEDIRQGLANIAAIDVRVETTSLNWGGYDKVRQDDPDLVIVHRSAFEDQTIDGPEVKATKKFHAVLRELSSTRAKFLIYTRASSFAGEANRRLQTERIEKAVPELKGRISIFDFEGRHADFRDGLVIQSLKTQITRLLGLT